MSIIIRLQNLPWAANALDIRQYFNGLQIPEGGVHIVGGEMGDAFIAFSTDEDARQAFLRSDGQIKGVKIKLLLSSRTEMQRVIEQARTQSMAAFMLPTAAPPVQMPAPVPAAVPPIVPAMVPEVRRDYGDDYTEKRRDRRRSRSKSRDRRDRSRDRRERRRDRGRSKSREKRDKRRGRSKERTRSRDRDRGSRRDKGRSQENREPEREEKKSKDIRVNRQQMLQPTLNIIPPTPVIPNDVPSLLAPWGLGSAAKTDIVAALANLQAHSVNGFQTPQVHDQPRSLMDSRFDDNWPNGDPSLRHETYGIRNRADYSANPNQGLRNTRADFEPLRKDYDLADEDNDNGDYRRDFTPRMSQADLRSESSTRKSRFESTFRESKFSTARGRYEDNEGLPVNACVALEPFDGSYGDLRRFFSGLPINYRGIKVIHDEYGHKTGVCYVQFREERFKRKALDMDGLQVNGETVSIRHISDEEYEEAIDRYNPKMDELEPQAMGRNNKMAKFKFENSPEIQNFTCLKVDGLPTIVKEQDILHIFSQYPLISLHMDVKPKGGTVAYVKFGGHDVAKQALRERAQHVIHGKPVGVKPCSDGEFDLVNQKQAGLFQNQESKVEPVSDCLVMSNLPVKTTDRDISDFFSDIGLIPLKIHLVSNSVGFTGQAYCEFESPEDAAQATVKDQTLMGANKVSVKMLPREEMEKVLGSSLPHPGLGPGETLAPGTPLPPIKPEVEPQPTKAEEQQLFTEEVDITNEEPIQNEEGEPEHYVPSPRPMLPFRGRPGFPNQTRFHSRFDNFERPRGRFEPDFGPRGPHFSRGGPRGGYRGRGGRFPPRGAGRFAPPSHRADTPPVDALPGCTVYMDNVPFKAGTNEILDFFAGYNCSNEVSRMYNNDHTPSSLARVTFYNAEDASRAVRELNGERIWNRPITLTQE